MAREKKKVFFNDNAVDQTTQIGQRHYDDSKTFKLLKLQVGEDFKNNTCTHTKKKQLCTLDTYNHGQLIRAQQIDQTWDQASLDHHLNALICAVCEVRDGPTCVSQHLPVVAVQ